MRSQFAQRSIGKARLSLPIANTLVWKSYHEPEFFLRSDRIKLQQFISVGHQQIINNRWTQINLYLIYMKTAVSLIPGHLQLDGLLFSLRKKYLDYFLINLEFIHIPL
ncbi:MAG TPA: hypothetical protein VE956_13545 [Nodularia sp. (in: cyanobacteria)]|nr:hypothetical protein [Nodularia sp. (in: cyanobacteria)]